MMSPSPIVMKFGGTSLADARAIEQVSRIIEARRESRAAVVVSALGGVTDALLEGTRQAAHCRPGAALGLIDEQLGRHSEAARALLTPAARAAVEAQIESSRADLGRLLRAVAARPAAAAPLRDEIASHGERLSARLMAAVLGDRGLASRYVDARRCIVTDEAHGCATARADLTEQRTRAELEPLLDASAVPVLGGFIGASLRGVTTTLGRNGSDYTAALVAAALSAAEVQIWTDVTGVLTADPRVVERARIVPHLSYEEAEALACFGAKVLHPKTIQPLSRRGIPLRICSSYAPEEASTIVSANAHATPCPVKAIAHKKDVALVCVTAGAAPGAGEFPRALSAVLERHRADTRVISVSDACAALTLEDEHLPRIYADLRRLGAVEVETGRAVVCMVGAAPRAWSWVAAQARAILSGIALSSIPQGAPGGNVYFVVEGGRVGEVVTRLHAAFFECDVVGSETAAAGSEVATL